MNVSPSPMQLNFYFIESFSFKIDLEHADHEALSQSRLTHFNEEDVHAEFELGESAEDQRKYRIIITVESAPGKKLPWVFMLKLHGFFEVSEDFIKKENARDLVCVNGRSMLFSVAREVLFASTGRGPFGAVFLPTVRFAPGAQAPEPAPGEK